MGIKGTSGNEKTVNLAYGSNNPDGRQYCFQGKWVLRHNWATLTPESRYVFGTDAVFASDEGGLTVTVFRNAQIFEGWFEQPASRTITGEAELFFKAVPEPR